MVFAIAVEACASDAFAQSSMNPIAERAGVSKSLICHCYPIHEALLFQAMRRVLNPLVAEKTSDSVTPSGQTLRANVAHGGLHEYCVGRRHQVLAVDDVRSLPLTQRDQILTAHRTVVNGTRGGLAICVPRLRGEAVKAVTVLLLGTVNWIHTWYPDRGAVSPAMCANVLDTMKRRAAQGLADFSASGQAA